MHDGGDDLHALDEELAYLARSRGRLRLRIGEVLEALVRSGGHRELGFNSLRDYALERLSRSGGWAAESRTVARRVAGLPCVRRAFDEGRIGWCKLELLCRHATPETESALVLFACTRSVRALRAAFAEPREEVEDGESERVTLTRRLSVEDALLLEATLAMIEHTSEGSSQAECVDWLLAEAFASLVAYVPAEKVDLRDALVRHAEEARARMEALARERDEMEVEVEGELPVTEAIEGRAPFDWDAPLPSDPNELDKLARAYMSALDGGDLWLGQVLSPFFRERRYERLGYASDGQYARERLGMSRSAAWERVQLARRTRRFEALADAVRRGEVGTHAARLVASVATAETMAAWIERAKRTTFKYLSEDVRIVEAAIRLEGESADRRPPDAERTARYREWRRDVLSGEMFRRAVQMSGWQGGEESTPSVQMSGCDVPRAPAFPFTVSSPAGRAHRGEVDVQVRLPKDVAVFWMELENLYDCSGIDAGFVEWLCAVHLEAWLPALGRGDKWEHIARRDGYECTCPVCSRKDQTDHHIRFRAHGGGDEPENQTSPCFRDHIEGIHMGRLRVSGTAPDGLTWLIGRKPIMVVRGRERQLLA